MRCDLCRRPEETGTINNNLEDGDCHENKETVPCSLLLSSRGLLKNISNFLLLLICFRRKFLRVMIQFSSEIERNVIFHEGIVYRNNSRRTFILN